MCNTVEYDLETACICWSVIDADEMGSAMADEVIDRAKRQGRKVKVYFKGRIISLTRWYWIQRRSKLSSADLSREAIAKASNPTGAGQ